MKIGSFFTGKSIVYRGSEISFKESNIQEVPKAFDLDALVTTIKMTNNVKDSFRLIPENTQETELLSQFEDIEPVTEEEMLRRIASLSEDNATTSEEDEEEKLLKELKEEDKKAQEEEEEE